MTGPGQPYPTWIAYDRITGAQVVVDDRTFNEAYHSREPLVEPDAADDAGAEAGAQESPVAEPPRPRRSRKRSSEPEPAP